MARTSSVARRHDVDALRLVHPGSGVQVGQDGVGQAEEGTAEQEPYRRRHPDRDALRLGHLDGRGKQGPKAGSNHHARRKSQHGVEQTLVQASSRKHNRRPQRRDEPRKSPRQEGLNDGRQIFKPERQASEHGMRSLYGKQARG